MKKILNFGKSYWVEILFALVVSAMMVILKKELVTYLLVVIITFSIIMFSLYFILTTGINEKSEEKKYNKDEVVKRFREIYGYYPDDKGFVFIDFHAPYNFYLCAVSQEVIDAYKEQQRILRWMSKWYISSLIIAVAFCLGIIVGLKDVFHPFCLTAYIFIGSWIILYRRLNKRFQKTMDQIKRGETIEFLDDFC